MSEHPSPELLRAFGLGRLEHREMDSVGEHVAVCDTCCQRLARVHDDTLIELCKAAGAETAADPQAAMSDDALRAARESLETAFADHPRYRLRSPLGQGGMGLVYKAEHRLMDRLVAIKVIHPALTANPKAIDRFRREIKAAGQLSHPNIVAALDAEQTGPFHYLVMEFARGVSLDRIVRQRGAFTLAGACRIIQQAAEGLEHAHRKGMVHRDIKPHNLLATLDGQVKILDFGLARLASEHRADGELTGDGVLGTPEYMAPEQIQRANEADIRADIYSLGCTLFYLLAGHSPYAADSHTDVLIGHLNKPIPRLSSVRSDVPNALEQVYLQMVAKDPAQRFATPADVSAAMEELLRSGQLSAKEDSPSAVPVSVATSTATSAAALPAQPIELVAPQASTPETPAVDLQQLEAELNQHRPPSTDPLAALPVEAERRWAPPAARRGMGASGWAMVAAAVAIAVPLAFLAFRGGGDMRQGGVVAPPAAKPLLVFVPQQYFLQDWQPLESVLQDLSVRYELVSTAPEAVTTDGQGPELSMDLRLDEVQASDFAGIVVIGGNVDVHLTDTRLQQLLQEMRQRDALVGGLCAGQRLLMAAGVDAKYSEEGQFNQSVGPLPVRRQAGARVVVDGNVITGTSYRDAEQFARAVAGELTRQ
ncbi:MAG: protein kinase [Planctomycetales bacterium]|nr:protein kinase [Planctomycetales bacterium]